MKTISKFNILLMALSLASHNTIKPITWSDVFNKKTLLIGAGIAATLIAGAYGFNSMRQVKTITDQQSPLDQPKLTPFDVTNPPMVEKPSAAKIVAKGVGTGILASLSYQFGNIALGNMPFLIGGLATRNTPVILSSLGVGGITGGLSYGTGYGALKLGTSTYKDIKDYNADSVQTYQEFQQEPL